MVVVEELVEELAEEPVVVAHTCTVVKQQLGLVFVAPEPEETMEHIVVELVLKLE